MVVLMDFLHCITEDLFPGVCLSHLCSVILLRSHLEAVDGSELGTQAWMQLTNETPSCLMAVWEDMTETSVCWLLPSIHAHKCTAAADA